MEHLWLIEKLVVFGNYTDVLTIDDLKTTMHSLQAYTQRRTFRIHYIAHMENVERVAASIPQFKAMAQSINQLPVDWVVVVNPRKATARQLVNTFAEAAFQLTRTRFHSVDSIEDAVAFLAKQDDFVAQAFAGK